MHGENERDVTGEGEGCEEKREGRTVRSDHTMSSGREHGTTL